MYRLAEEQRPKGWEFWAQPGGLLETAPGIFSPNPDAENLENLPADYYEENAEGATTDYVRVYHCGRYGFVQQGKPVFPEFRDDIHAARDVIPVDPNRTLYVGLDFGLTPAAVFCQKTKPT